MMSVLLLIFLIAIKIVNCLETISCSDSQFIDHDISNGEVLFVNSNSTDMNCFLRLLRTSSLALANSTQICQIRIEFEQFDLSQPINGHCDRDQLTFSGHEHQNQVLPPLCGSESDNHRKSIVNK